MKKTPKYLLALSLYVFCFSTFISCGGDDDPIVNPEPDPTPEPITANSSYLSCIEVPKMEEGNIFIQHSTLAGEDSVMTYCLEYSPTKFHSRWVAFRFDATTSPKNTNRSNDPFADDPSLTKYKIGNGGFGTYFKDLDGNNKTSDQNFDRGHICASNDRVYSVEANEQTFYMTNMSPQMHSFNSFFWAGFETHVQDLMRSGNKYSGFADTLYVVKGGTIADVKIGGKTESGIIGTIKRPNQSNVVVPKYYYMALLAIKDGKYNALGFWMEHKEYGYTDKNPVPKSVLKSHIVTIDELEEYTGIDFFHNLPDDIEQEVEATSNPAIWKL